MRKEISIDWLIIALLGAMIMMGWFTVYSTSTSDDSWILDLNAFHGRQLLFILVAIGLGIGIMMLDTKFIEFVSYIAYGLSIFLLLVVLGLGKVTNGALSWIPIGPFSLQPSEFAKVATLLALAKFMSRYNFSLRKISDLAISGGMVLLPMILIVAQNDMGSALVFASLIFMFFREGLHPMVLIGIFLVGLTGTITIFMDDIDGYVFKIIWFMFILLSVSNGAILWFKKERPQAIRVFAAGGIGIAITAIPVFFVESLFTQVIIFTMVILTYLTIAVITGFSRKNFSLVFTAIIFVALAFVSGSIGAVTKNYQRLRFKVLILSEEDVKGNRELESAIYNLRQSKLAIGSGGVWGKGYKQATHTKGDFVPEEHTDFIFCVIGEEHGWVGSMIVLILFFLFLSRILYLAENSKSRFARVYGYGAASIIFFHLMINIGMTIGLVPTVGIPLPFFSYGGSSMMAFTMMTFILVNHYSYRVNILGNQGN